MTQEQKAYLSELIETATPNLTSFLLRRYPVAQVEEVLQETYLAACREVETLMGHEKPEAWLFTAAVNRAKRLVTELGTERQRYGEMPDDIIDIRAFQEDTIDEILPKDTPAKDRTVLKMYYEQKMTAEEIAEELCVAPDNARQRIKRARDRLKKALGTTFLIFLI